jgi:hypothetical protein
LAKNSVQITRPSIRVSEAAQQVRDHELAGHGDEAEQDARRRAGQGEREGHAPEGRERRCAEILGGLNQALILPVQDRVQRQDHEGQVGVDEPQQDGGLGVEDLDRRQAERRKRRIQHPGRLQDRDPGVNADQEAGPERQDHRHYQRLPRTAAGNG